MNRCAIGSACTALLALNVGLSADVGTNVGIRTQGTVSRADEGSNAPAPDPKGEGGVAGGIGVVCIETGTPTQCQLPDQASARTSDVQADLKVAERFRNDTGGPILISKICWWGIYLDFAPAPDVDCSTDPAHAVDAFTITFYANDQTVGCPNSIPGTVKQVNLQGGNLAVTRSPTGGSIGAFLEFEYSGTLTVPVAVAAGECVWIEIVNDSTGTVSPNCVWLWETAPPGDSFAVQDLSVGTYVDAAIPDDLAFCVNMVLGNPAACNFVVDAGCAGATNPCGAPAGPGVFGCADPCCCTQVCAQTPLCCLVEWTQSCAISAIGNGCATPPYECTAPGYPNDCCTSPTSVADGAVVAFNNANANSDGAPEGNDGDCIPNGTVGKDLWYKFAAPENGTLVAATCGPGATFDTTIEIYDIGSGAYDCQDVKDQVGLVGCNDDGGYVDPLIGPCVASLTSAAMAEVTGGINYLIRLGGFDNLTGTGNISFDFTPGVDQFDTGLPRTVTFNGTPNNLVGFSSGNLQPGQPTLPQRRTAQAFSIAGGTREITQLWLQGFQPLTATNTTLTMEVHTRTALTTAPTPASLIASRAIAYPVSFNEPTINLADPNTRHLFNVTPTFNLNPGNYWLTVYSGNTQPGVVESQFAWFTNAENGINNACPLLPASCAPATTCTGQPGGTQAMWRSCTYPVPGFGGYFTPAIALDPAGCPTCIAADLLNTSFKVRGRPVSNPCPWDCAQPPNGVVDTVDFLALLQVWGVLGGNGPCDFDNNGVIDTVDFLALLQHWGLCL